MKTKNVFTLSLECVTMEIFDVSSPDAERRLLATRNFDLAAIPAVLANGETPQSLAAYGLSRLMQDRNSSVSDANLLEHCSSIKEAAEARLEAYGATFDVLAGGNFKAVRASSADAKHRGVVVDSFFALGFSRFLQSKGKEIDEMGATVLLQGMGNEQRAAMRAHEGVAALIREAKAEVQASVADMDLSDLFD